MTNAIIAARCTQSDAGLGRLRRGPRGIPPLSPFGDDADAKVQARVAKLARKCNEGALTPEELAEYDRYIAFADLVAILQAKARLLLAKKS